jgi:hypothetical protein
MDYNNTAILFLIFNRPDTTARVFEAIRRFKPRRLFVAADGPRADRDGEKELCEATRRLVVDSIDWQCEVKTRFLDENLGCRYAVSSHLHWFFDNVDEGIIIEDDCLVSDDFFTFTAQMLDRYRNETQVMHIAGANFQNGTIFGSADYYFSRIPHIWGWASWKRAFKDYDVDMTDFPEVQKSKSFKAVLPEKRFAKWSLCRAFKLTFLKSKAFDTWDIQYHYHMLKAGGVAITPNVNLVSNIGGSNTHEINPLFCEMKVGSMPSLPAAPSQIAVNREADNRTFDAFYKPNLRNAILFFADMISFGAASRIFDSSRKS